MTFALLQKIEIRDGSTSRTIALYEGDLAHIPEEHRADILVVLAFPNDYTPSRTSLIGALNASGLSIGSLAVAKAHDLRDTCAFWLSKPIIGPAADLNVRRVACFEPRGLGSPPSVVGDLFRGLFPFLDDRNNKVVAMPLLASGDQGYSPEIMLRSILDAATHWLAKGLAISELKIVERNSARAAALSNAMAAFKAGLSVSNLQPAKSQAFDIFLSFSTTDSEAADIARAELSKKRTPPRIFDYRLQIDKGRSWQEEIDRAISSSNAVIALLSPSYFKSPECREELMQARLRNKRSESTVLFPIYWRDWGKELDLWLQVLSFVDCREGDHEKLVQAMREIGQN